MFITEKLSKIIDIFPEREGYILRDRFNRVGKKFCCGYPQLPDGKIAFGNSIQEAFLEFEKLDDDWVSFPRMVIENDMLGVKK